MFYSKAFIIVGINSYGAKRSTMFLEIPFIRAKLLIVCLICHEIMSTRTGQLEKK